MDLRTARLAFLCRNDKFGDKEDERFFDQEVSNENIEVVETPAFGYSSTSEDDLLKKAFSECGIG